MKYTLRAEVLDHCTTIELSETEFEDIRLARKTLDAAFALEEIYNLLLANYGELEVCAIQAATNEMIHWKVGYEDAFNVRNEINRRVINFLSTARLYVDQTQQWTREAGGDPTLVKAELSAQYDEFAEYRFIEALRNHAQHCGLAVHGVITQNTWLPKGQAEKLEICVQPYAAKASLQADSKFKKTVLAECSDRVILLPSIRRYVESIGHIQKVVRSQVEPNAVTARAQLDSRISAYTVTVGNEVPGLVALAIKGDVTVERIPILVNWDDVRLKLLQRNRSLSSLSRAYVTSRQTA